MVLGSREIGVFVDKQGKRKRTHLTAPIKRESFAIIAEANQAEKVEMPAKKFSR